MFGSIPEGFYYESEQEDDIEKDPDWVPGCETDDEDSD